jgi:hypothetical protein
MSVFSASVSCDELEFDELFKEFTNAVKRLFESIPDIDDIILPPRKKKQIGQNEIAPTTAKPKLAENFSGIYQNMCKKCRKIRIFRNLDIY